MKYCERCKEEPEFKINVPFQEEPIEVCLECYILVWELFARWLNVKGMKSKLSKFESNLKDK